ncbi:MAG TPA: polyamine aminopropyltransferase [Burkholderiales bacterium]|nr:polyamine aminopropyltransferase [Burkholderiales bacterium]
MSKSNKSGPPRLNRWRKSSDTSVELSEESGVRFLHLGSDLIQSAMRISRPNDLEVAYTQCMMGFLLFNPTPKHVLMIGLGGGSLAKFIYHRIPEASVIAVEINPQVVAAANNFFCLPPEDDRFRTVIADGAEYVAGHPEGCDVLIVDGYEDGTMPEVLGSQSFYEHAFAALRSNGLMVINFLGRDRKLATYLDRIKACFPGGLLQLKDGEYGNVIVFAFKQSPDRQRLKTLEKRAVDLEDRYELPFSRYAKELTS